MPTIFSVKHKDIAGDDYETFLRAALSRFDSFSLVWRADLPYAASRHAVGQGLRHHQITKQQGRIVYRFDADALPTLLLPGSLFQWRLPSYPEDPTFYRDGRAGFVSVSHEEMAWILDSEFARLLPSRLGFAEEVISERAYRSYCDVA
jgi:hypothetical protein